MARTRTLEERLMGASVLRMSFTLSAREGTPEFKAIYEGVLEDLKVTDAQVEAFTRDHRAEVESRARQAAGKHVADA